MASKTMDWYNVYLCVLLVGMEIDAATKAWRFLKKKKKSRIALWPTTSRYISKETQSHTSCGHSSCLYQSKDAVPWQLRMVGAEGHWAAVGAGAHGIAGWLRTSWKMKYAPHWVAVTPRSVPICSSIKRQAPYSSYLHPWERRISRNLPRLQSWMSWKS